MKGTPNLLVSSLLVVALANFFWPAAVFAQTEPTFTQQPTNQAVVVGSNVVFRVAVTGDGPISFQWRVNGTNLPNVVRTIVGTGAKGFAGDGGLASAAVLDSPYGACLDAAGNLFIADSANNRIRKVDTNGVITTVAGSGPYYPDSGGYSGDGGPATNAVLNLPTSVSVDSGGNLFLVDSFNQRVRKVGTNGLITTVAGNGSAGFSGDNSQAVNAQLNYPSCVKVDKDGTLLITDSLNNRVRKVAPSGIITTVAGNGVQDFTGDGGSATEASLIEPTGVDLDSSGNLFIGDWGNDRVRKIDSHGTITTAAGNGNGAPQSGAYMGDGGQATNASLYYPYAVVVDARGNLLIADSNNDVIRNVNTNGIISTVAGSGVYGGSGDGGPALKAQFAYPFGVAVDASSNIFIADCCGNRIRQVPVQGPSYTLTGLTAANAGGYDVVVTSPYGCVTSSVATLTILLPPGITTQPHTQAIVVSNSVTLSVSNNGTPPFGYQWFFTGAPLANQTSNAITFAAVDAANAGTYQVVVTNLYGMVTSSVATLTVLFPPSLTQQPVAQTAVVGSTLTLSVGLSGTAPLTCRWRLNGTNLPVGLITTVAGSGSAYPYPGGYSGDGGAATNARLNGPTAVSLDANGKLFVGDSGNNRVRKVGADGLIATIAGNGTCAYAGDGGWATDAALSQPYGLGVDPSGNVRFADQGNHRLRQVAPGGLISTIAGSGSGYPAAGSYGGDGGQATNANLSGPKGVGWDVSANCFIADTGNHRIRKIGANGVIVTVAGTGAAGYSGDNGPATSAKLNNPTGVAVDGLGNLFIADFGSHRIRRVDTNGVIFTVAGNGTARYSGDGGLATNACLNSPSGVAVDAAGNLLIADSGNSVVRMVRMNGIIITVAGYSAGFSGDGGIATSARLGNPYGLAVNNASGDIFIADTRNHRVRRVSLYQTLADPARLILPNVQTFSAGNYDIIVSNSYGSITSTVATVTVVLPPSNLTAAVTSGRDLKVQFYGTPGYRYTVAAADSLDSPIHWQTVFTNEADAQGHCVFIDSNAAAAPCRFYRATIP
jgi:hypothetical protein